MELKSIKKANENEIDELLTKVWGKDNKMIDYCKKNELFYKTFDNYVFSITPYNKMTITKIFWYDDELPKEERPTASLDNFINENLQYNCNEYDFIMQEKSLNNKFIFNPSYTNCKQSVNPQFLRYARDFDLQNMIREMTADEIEDWLNILLEQKTLYIERLKKYYSKYSKCVNIRGYWANR